MVTETPMMDLDMDPIAEVLARAIDRHGASIGDLVDLGRIPHGCGKALASGRLAIRRYAEGGPGPGERWTYVHTMPYIPDELERMRTDGTMDGFEPDALDDLLGGCGCYDCLICNPKLCESCGRIVEGQCAV